MAEILEAARLRPPSLGLLPSSLDGFSGGGEPNPPRWGNALGVQWSPEVVCPATDGQFVFDAASCPSPLVFTGGKAADMPTVQTAVALGAAVGFECSTEGMDAPEADVEARARRVLEVVQHRLIEDEFWAGTLVQSKGLGNTYLTKTGGATVIEPGSHHPVRALAQADQWAGAHVVGQAFIHANRQVVTLWEHYQLLHRVGNVLLTVNDNVVVPGSGYGTGGGTYTGAPDTPQVFVTAPVVVRLGAVQAIAPTGDVISANNLRRAFAWRQFLVTFDPCGFGAIRLDLCTTDFCQGS